MRVLKLLVAGALGVGLAVGGVVQANPAAAEIYVDDVPVNGWDVNGRVLAAEIVGDVVYVGGNFTAAISPTGTSVARNRLAAFSMTTGELITGWRADAGAGVTSLATDGESLYVGGHFGRINNVVRTRVAKVSLATGAVDPTFVASADAGVRALAVRGNGLFVGGAFLEVNGVAKNRVAKLDKTTGALDPTFRAAASGPVYSLVAHPQQDVVYAAGPFAQLNGVTRAGVGGLHGTTGATTGPAFASSARPTLALDVNDDGSRLFAAGGSGANEVSAWSTSSGARTWRVVTMGDNQAVEHYRGTVLAGFHDGFRNDNSIKVVAIDAGTGAVDADWRPRINEFWGVFAIDASDAGVVVGGDFRSVSGVPTGYVARFDAVAPPPPPPPPPAGTAQLLGAHTDWAYWDRGTRPAGWQTEAYDDGAWPRGRPQLGYGDGDETTVISFGDRAGAKHVTSYFRATFAQDRLPSAVRLSLLADDGAVVYVNGVEVVRDNMPAGTVDNDTRAASNRSGGAENAFRDFVVSPALLHTGTNTVAVEVHQDVPNSSDLGLDLRLEADYPAP